MWDINHFCCALAVQFDLKPCVTELLLKEGHQLRMAVLLIYSYLWILVTVELTLQT
jgi:hypothetical protein